MYKITFKRSVFLAGIFLICFSSFATVISKDFNILTKPSNSVHNIDYANSNSRKYNLQQVYNRLNSLFLQKSLSSTVFFSNECATATQLTVNEDATCTIATAGNFQAATLSTGFTMGCDEWQTPVKDMFYKFTATATQHVISFTEEQNTWSVNLQLFNITACTIPETALYCGQIITANNLVVGNEYLVRVFMTDTWGGPESNFQLCVRTLNAPDNDDCEDATVAPVNPGNECEDTVDATFQDATLSEGFNTGCNEWSVPYRDVWFEFTATSNAHAISISNYNEWGLAFQVYHAENGCTLTTPISCLDGNYLILSNLEVGDLYKIRVFTTNINDFGTFTLCVNTLIPPPNDECADPIEVPVNDGEECNLTEDGTFNGSTLSNGFENGCESWISPAKDVWFKFTATALTHGISLSNYGDGFAGNIGVEVFNAAACNELSSAIVCSTDLSSQVNNLVVGNEYLVRIYTTSMSLNTDFTICINTLSPPIYVSTTDYTVEELVKEVLVGNECLVSNITWSTGISHGQTGNGIAYFNKNGSSFTLEDGILLTTGDASAVIGPANGPVMTGGAWPGDQQLFDYMIDQGLEVDDYNDASILEFDFVPTKTDFSFDFIFASNEYGSFQCSYSDAFAFFLTDLTTNVTTNLAVVPGNNAPISVTTIRKAIHSPENWDTGEPNCEDENPEYFDKCYDPAFNGLDPLIAPVNVKGHTVPMTASTTVEPGRTYHIKMVIADRDDNNFDSSVFLLGGSFDIGSIDFGEDLTFENGEAICSNDSYIIDTGLGGDFSFTWYKDDVLINGATEPSYEVTESGTYKVIATFNNTDCSLEQSIFIEVYPNLNEVFEDPENMLICRDTETLDLTFREQQMIGSNTGVYTFEYFLSLEDLENDENAILNPENHPYTGYESVFVKIITSSKYKCYGVKELQIDIIPVPDPMLINDILICNGYKLPQLPTGQRYFTGSAATGNELQPGQILREGTYNLFVYSNNEECYEEHEFRVVVENCIIPKGISPNGDGLNDRFDLAKYYPTSVKIYNRYGAMVYEHGAGYTNQWLGQDKSDKILPGGTYFYKFTTETNEYTGYIYVQRETK